MHKSPPATMSKRAVLIGCNYPGTKAELKGCIHDVQRMHRSLLDRYKFPAENITVLIDTDSSYVQPTGQNIRSALSDLVAAANPGDILFVHYSGHGTRLPAEDDDTGYDECIVPTDMNLITDDDFREFVDKVPEKCIITIVSDSCHSGGLINAAKEQIGESTQRNKTGLRFFKSISATAADAISSHNNRHRDDRQGSGYFQNKSLPLSTLIEILKQKTGKNDIEVGKLRPTLFDIFGDDASPKLRKFLKAVRKFVRHDRDEGCSKKQEGGILISGCQSDESAGDTMPEGEPDEAYGVLSNAIQMIIAERDGKVSNQEVVRRARKLLKKQGFTQHPGLYCSDEHVDAPFVCYI